MAHFIAEIKGRRGAASRLGDERSGIWSHAQGWDSGVLVQGRYRMDYLSPDENSKEDVFHIYATSGSNGNSPDTFIGKVINGEFIPVTKSKGRPVDSSQYTDTDRILAEIIKENADNLLAVPGAYEVFAEHFNNEIIDRWEQEQTGGFTPTVKMQDSNQKDWKRRLRTDL